MNWPGDDGDRSNYDLFVRPLMADLKAYAAVDRLIYSDTQNLLMPALIKFNSLGLRLLIAPCLATPCGPTGWPILQATTLFQSTLLKSYGLPERQISINEYANMAE
ncbi:hypothetical protein CBS147317_1892 [Penicillium roqueforti]|nr:hypothetical protein CBS147372_1243 [Penicillium roqueforti]KAI2722297.1 hypothetical protein CBS147354_5589 [Penicillium roqueforti]KAI3165949.1 hypothetical protein CBS147317_1892 [Penicillium roqueforti]KAI3225658.1 hypothetical protein DTO012A9_9479 [Penicillium roqueforti]KAI3242181.1 hypothetical protein CBS147310_31 [Penicillium roqueforti]